MTGATSLSHRAGEESLGHAHTHTHKHTNTQTHAHRHTQTQMHAHVQTHTQTKLHHPNGIIILMLVVDTVWSDWRHAVY